MLRRTLDFSKEIELFKKNGVTHVTIFSHDNDLLTFVSQANAKGFHPVYIGSDGWGSNRNVHAHFFSGAGKGSEFVGIRNSYWKEDDNRPITRQFRSTFKKRYDTDPDAWSAISFDSAWLLIQALEKVKASGKGPEIQSALKKLKSVSLVTSPAFTFDDENSPHKNLYLYRIDKSGVKYEATLK